LSQSHHACASCQLPNAPAGCPIRQRGGVIAYPVASTKAELGDGDRIASDVELGVGVGTSLFLVVPSMMIFDPRRVLPPRQS
jgi:hypothetical protein